MAIEEIEPIAAADGLSGISESQASIVSYLQQIHAPPSQIALAESEVRASESTFELAADGDSLALARLEAEQAPSIVRGQDSPALAAFHLTHPVGPHEDGKGDRIDIYD